ncbi:hypothetical protein [Chryseobacterium sp.]|uniref:hypothetical protein n=1 Tax=Chryseobacterium sp. TaxID=1871047 RepID=UPI00289D388A|nr:hypothetical protein [Chryseobacterium sp.]
MENSPKTNQLNFNASNYTFAFLHSHHDKLYPIFSPDDIIALNTWIKGAIDYNNQNNLPKINFRQLTISVITKYGTYLISFDGTTIEPFPNYSRTEWNKLIKKYEDFMTDAGNSYD